MNLVHGVRQPQVSLPNLLRAPIKLRTETTLFILANTLDVVMTLILLSTGAFRESNPLANFVLEQWGTGGMIYFKFAFVAGIAAIAQFVATRQLGTARGLLILGTLMVGGVVAYSSYLFVNYLQVV